MEMCIKQSHVFFLYIMCQENPNSENFTIYKVPKLVHIFHKFLQKHHNKSNIICLQHCYIIWQ